MIKQGDVVAFLSPVQPQSDSYKVQNYIGESRL